jgi:hypothetical protein
MKSTRHGLLISLALAAASTGAWAQTTLEEHAAHHPAQQSAPADKAKTATSAEQKAIKDMENGAAAMQALMDQVKNTKDPAERRKLLEQHHQIMLKQTQAMQHMSCGMGMSGGMSGTGPGSKAAPGGAMGPGGQMMGQ